MIKYTVFILVLALASADPDGHPSSFGYATDNRGKLSLEFGAQFVVQKAIQAQAIPPGIYKVDKINSAIASDDLSESFDVHLVAKNDKAHLRAFYCVDTNLTTNTRQVVFYGFVTDSHLSSVVFSAEDSQEEVISEVELHLIDLYSYEQIVDDDLFATEVPLLIYTEEEWVVGETEHEVHFDLGYGRMEIDVIPESSAELNQNSYLQTLLLFGLDQVLNTIFTQSNNTSLKGSANSQFHISRIFGVTSNEVDMSTVEYLPEGPGGPDSTYEFDVEVQNEQGLRLRISFAASGNYSNSIIFTGVRVDSYRFRPLNVQNPQK